ncbi:cellulose biosynthesis protein BcsD, partial [Campylobacter coli]|uniref:cellulose biosynthesis protein BcsD n=1 Tax=Campylobacter coli TaxID=195 RepID=UPI003C776E15
MAERRQLLRRVGQRQADARHVQRQVAAGIQALQQRPNQLLAHRQHVAVAVRFGEERMRHRRRREDEQRRL